MLVHVRTADRAWAERRTVSPVLIDTGSGEFLATIDVDVVTPERFAGRDMIRFDIGEDAPSDHNRYALYPYTYGVDFGECDYPAITGDVPTDTRDASTCSGRATRLVRVADDIAPLHLCTTHAREVIASETITDWRHSGHVADDALRIVHDAHDDTYTLRRGDADTIVLVAFRDPDRRDAWFIRPSGGGDVLAHVVGREEVRMQLLMIGATIDE